VLVVAALGGNALLRRGEPPTADKQRANVRVAARTLADIVHGGHRLVVTHGNGPQVGLLALQAAAYARGGRADPLDVLGAETEGMIGYLVEQELGNLLPGRTVATLLTRVEVDPDDPAFTTPTKPIGPVYECAEAERLAVERGWAIAPDGAGCRRVVPSPEPRHIVEIAAIELLVAREILVICAGGGGIPAVRSADGGLEGVEAVIDKDAASALLAQSLAADALLLLTDVDAVYVDWQGARERPIRRGSPASLGRLDLPAGSMGPKVAAARRFVAATGRRAGIGRLEDAAAVLAGTAGTTVAPDA
jgi:carbamate kinase